MPLSREAFRFGVLLAALVVIAITAAIAFAELPDVVAAPEDDDRTKRVATVANAVFGLTTAGAALVFKLTGGARERPFAAVLRGELEGLVRPNA
jgi:hypothetical protein